MAAARQLARLVATAQRGASAPPVEVVKERITWGELGCPSDIGLYRTGAGREGMDVRVKKIHLIVAENDPAALFTVVTFRPPLGPVEHMLGHRVA